MTTPNAKSTEPKLQTQFAGGDLRAQDMILLGVIGKPKGIRGQVWAYSHTSNPRDIASYGALTDLKTKRSFSVKAGECKGAQVVLTIDGVTDRNAAELLRGTELYVARNVLPSLPKDRFYFADLIGLDVIDQNGQNIGTVLDVFNYGAGDVIEIKSPGQTEPLCLLFHDDYVRTIDLANKRMIVDVPVMVDADDAEEGDDA